MDVAFKINEFEGPLDLLLHLIKENKMDIMNIEIEKITDQYMSYLASQERLNLEIASEYLVLASELIEIKSKLLLPNTKNTDEVLDEEDPRAELVNRLLEYQNYKEITKMLQEREELRKEIYTKAPENVKNYVDELQEVSTDVTLDDLVEAFKKYLERKKETRPLNTKITVKEITVSSRRHEIKKLLNLRGRVSFCELFPVASREYIVATFLAILEMAKSKELLIIQNDTFDDIICEVANEE